MIKPSEITNLPVADDMPAEVRNLREQASVYLQSVIEDANAVPQIRSMGELKADQVEALGGGKDATTYLLKHPKTQVIIKFTTEAIDAKVEALKEWKKRSVRVPPVVSHGVVPASKQQPWPIKYLVQEAVLDDNGRIGETCQSFLARKPNKAQAVGRLMGAELSKLHQAVSERSFGDYADSSGNTAPYQSWNSYLLGFLEAQSGILQDLSVGQQDINAVKAYIDRCKFVKQGRYLHGDFSIRNAVVASYDPLEVNLFDPNPLIGDPSWDVAIPFNLYAFQKRQKAMDDGVEQDMYVRDQQFLIGFKQGYDRKIDETNLRTAQLMHTLLQIAYQGDKLESGEDREVELAARKQFATDLIKQMVKEVS